MDHIKYFDPISYSALIVAGLAALAYFSLVSAPASWLRSALKTLPLLCFALIAQFEFQNTFVGPFLTIPLVFSAMGDFALSRNGRSAFLYGLAAFALAHLLYIILFLGTAGLSPIAAFEKAPLLAIATVALALSSELWLTPYTGTLRWPVRIYIALIVVMVLGALTLQTQFRPVLYGAALFVGSDLLLAIDRFRLTENSSWKPWIKAAIWALYVVGQGLILFGFIGS